mgnify:FL=1
MKAKTFENLIRKVVREEIDYALRREIKSLKEDLRDEIKPSIVEHTERIVKTPQQASLKEKIMGTKPLKRNFVQNSTLNDLLNQTAAGDTNLNQGSSPVSLSESFETNTAPMDTTNMPPEVANAVTRDYSDLMKAMNKKRPIDRK